MITANDVAGVIPRDVPQDAPDSGVDTAGAGRVTAAYSAIKEAIRSNVFPPGYRAAEIEIAVNWE